jgi:hypothetical protein
MFTRTFDYNFFLHNEWLFTLLRQKDPNPGLTLQNKKGVLLLSMPFFYQKVNRYGLTNQDEVYDEPKKKFNNFVPTFVSPA